MHKIFKVNLEKKLYSVKNSISVFNLIFINIPLKWYFKSKNHVETIP